MKFVGAKWWKVDFHTHTPASLDYGKSEPSLRQTKCHRDWLIDFINKGIECVAVTDHNTGNWIDDLKIEAETLRAEGHTIHVFPGVEITANSNIHILAIFDPSKTASDIHAIVGAARFRGTRGDSNAVSEESAEKIIEEVKASGGVAIPAHIDMKAGLCQLSSSHTIRQICEKASAVEIIFPDQEREDTPLSRFKRLNIPLPEVIGSDAHHPKDIGRAYTWVKMAMPSIEGLRLALVDGKSSIIRSDEISSEPNQTSSTLLHSVSISNAKYAGRAAPLEINFNPWLNSIIGGRGSGKSSVLEFIRIGMDRGRDLLYLEENNEVRQSFQNFIKKSVGRDAEGVMLDDTEISCIYSKDGVYYRLNWKFLNWKFDTQAIVISRYDGKKWIEEHGDVYSRFPIKIFSQKQIFSLANNPNTLLKLIDESESVNFHQWKMHWDDQKNSFLRLCEQRRELQAKLANKNTLQGQLADINQKITLIEKSGHSDILSDYQYYRSRSQTIHSHLESLESSKNTMIALINEQPSPAIEAELFSTEQPSEMEVETGLKNLSCSFEGLKTNILQAITVFNGEVESFTAWFQSSGFSQALRSSEIKYQQLVSSLASQGVSNPAHYDHLIAQRNSVIESLKQLEAVEKQIQAFTDQINATYIGLITARRNLTLSRYTFIEQHIKGNSSIKIELEPFGNDDSMDRSFRDVIGRNDGAFSSDIYDSERATGFLYELSKSIKTTSYNFEGVGEGLQNRLDIIHNFKVELASRYGSGSIFNTRLGKRFLDFMSQLPIQTFYHLNLWFPDDKLTVKYHDGNRFKDISQGSAGQKASAILSFLLSYGTEPLVLDQPEDDLDNGLITSLIVSNLQSNKSSRQIIVVTHNPNIVVNGDSEYVIALQDKGQIQVSAAGALQELAVRKNVCEIMEGGEMALQQRYKRMFNL
ncbi:TrlF family AAA-like ATPase [Methylobacter sp. BlB1]|uniref:TrlF family AAA-like ATPase n=1 Tax=Methylobacter sp. BlB1 TaxID=2785914 RepID=UPI001895D2A0|nr:PHP-associated domain-containing protein [Methylobacter sp. BlB1]MBF6650426.1 hypothetical protein [Methylobacter sp. BlB1]